MTKSIKRTAPKRVRIETFKNITIENLMECSVEELTAWSEGIAKLKKINVKIETLKNWIDIELMKRTNLKEEGVEEVTPENTDTEIPAEESTVESKSLNQLVEGIPLSLEEGKVLYYLNEKLQVNFGDFYSGVDCYDISHGLNMVATEVQATIDSLVKKEICTVYSIDGDFETVNFKSQDIMKYEKFEAPKAPKKEKKVKTSEKPVKEKKAKKETKSSNKKDVSKPGIIATIRELVIKSGKKGITKAEVLDELIKLFPDREADKMKATVTVQIPGRITKEKFQIEKLENGRYRKAVK